MDLQVNYDYANKKRTRALHIRVTREELARYTWMAEQLEQPLTRVVRALCEAQYNALIKETDNGESSSAA